MLADKDRIFTNLYGFQDWRLAGARARGAWDGTKALIDKGHDWIINEIKASGLRGRGGAGFPTGLKWSFMPKSDPRPSYLVINADESEPGSCKDREIMRHDPHLLIEGALIASFAMRAHTCYIYVRGEFIRERERLQAAVDEAYAAKLIGKDNIHGWDFDLVVHHGAGAYICGEETALLESLEGKKGQPRLKPPFPANVGLYGAPTTVNNVESIAVVPDILRRGAAWFAALGKPNNTGTKLFQISGHVNKPVRRRGGDGHSAARADRQALRRRARRLGQPAGRHPRRLVDAADPGRPVPGPDDGLRRLSKLKSGIGTAAIIVMDKSTDIIKAIARIAYFYKHESCGQCTPCREGTGWMWRVLERMAHGRGGEERDRPAVRRDQAGRGPHHLRARRRGGLAGAGADPQLPPRHRGAHRRPSHGRKASGRVDAITAKATAPWTLLALIIACFTFPAVAGALVLLGARCGYHAAWGWIRRASSAALPAAIWLGVMVRAALRRACALSPYAKGWVSLGNCSSAGWPCSPIATR